MLAEKARSPRKTALVLLAITAAAGQLRPDTVSDPGAAEAAANGQPVHVHVKLRAVGARGATLAAMASRAEAMFAPPPGADDARARWVRVRAASPDDAIRVAE